ncbi:MAG TPA: hypothetical protein VFV59_10440 [Candidatus Limnocylindria bacterium]|nr:hypothetical protein [Candidatus Limnocylindria bacterium]
MTHPRLALPRTSGAVGDGRARTRRLGAGLLILGTLLAACSTAEVQPTPTGTAAPTSATASASPTPTATPSPTPEPTPRYTNEPDEDLAALIPTEAAGVPVVVAPFDEFALTPGDVAIAYGELGNRFASLVVAYVEQPRTTLYAMRLDGEPAVTEDLELFLATAGRYVGIAGLDPDPWTLDDSAGYRVWVRPEDNATAAGTMVYTWAAEDYVFLLIGVDDTVNRAIIEQLPTEPAPTPRPTASPSASAGSSAPASASPSGG